MYPDHEWAPGHTMLRRSPTSRGADFRVRRSAALARPGDTEFRDPIDLGQQPFSLSASTSGSTKASNACKLVCHCTLSDSHVPMPSMIGIGRRSIRWTGVASTRVRVSPFRSSLGQCRGRFWARDYGSWRRGPRWKSACNATPGDGRSSVGYDFGPLVLQGWLTSDVYERNYGGHDIRGWMRIVLPLNSVFGAPPPPITRTVR